MRTRIVFELDQQSDDGDAVMLSLHASFRERCGHLVASVVPRYVTVKNCRVADAMVETAGIVERDLCDHPESELCIYLSPRTLVIAHNPICSTIFVVRNRDRLMAARVHVMPEESLRPLVQQALAPEIALANRMLFDKHAPSCDDNAFALTVSKAIQLGYIQAHAFHRTEIGTA